MAKKQRIKRVIVITNRTDRALQKQLAKKLKAKLTWVVAKPRRIQAAAKSIAKGYFDYVLMFTGYLDHKTTEVIDAAAKKGDTPIVRANKGRPAAVEQALERDLKPPSTEEESQDETQKETPAE